MLKRKIWLLCFTKNKWDKNQNIFIYIKIHSFTKRSIFYEHLSQPTLFEHNETYSLYSFEFLYWFVDYIFKYLEVLTLLTLAWSLCNVFDKYLVVRIAWPFENFYFFHGALSCRKIDYCCFVNFFLHAVQNSYNMCYLILWHVSYCQYSTNSHRWIRLASHAGKYLTTQFLPKYQQKS